jgi:hypothetical protein
MCVSPTWRLGPAQASERGHPESAPFGPIRPTCAGRGLIAEVSEMRIVRWILVGLGVIAAIGVVYRQVTGQKETGDTAELGGVEQSHAA